MDRILRFEKYINSKQIAKLDLGGELLKILNDPNIDYLTWLAAQRLKTGMQVGYGTSFDFNGTSTNVKESEVLKFINSYNLPKMSTDAEIDSDTEATEQAKLENLNNNTLAKLDQAIENASVSEEERAAAEARAKTNPTSNNPPKSANRLSAKAKAGIGIASTLAVGGILALDLATMGDKNFSASSKAIDTGVHAATGALMSSGNPYAMIAGVALEGLNWITKAGGKTVLGYDVNINNSGYGNIGHMESESGRVWDRMDRKLARRNELARMALTAADISEDVAFEQEARANSVDNVLMQNTIALNGGIDTSLLGS